MARKSLLLFTVLVLMLTMVVALGACGADTATDEGLESEPGALPETGGELDATPTITDTFDMTDTGGTTGGTSP